jgi:hypothetical protein
MFQDQSYDGVQIGVHERHDLSSFCAGVQLMVTLLFTLWLMVPWLTAKSAAPLATSPTV